MRYLHVRGEKDIKNFLVKKIRIVEMEGFCKGKREFVKAAGNFCCFSRRYKNYP